MKLFDWSRLFSTLVLILAAVSAQAQAQDKKSVFLFLPITETRPTLSEADAQQAGKLQPSLRPNTPTEYHLYVYNPLPGGEKSFSVQMKSGSLLLKSAPLAIPARSWAQVVFPKPAPAAAIAPVPVPPTPAAKPAEPTPPGTKIAQNQKGKFALTLSLLNDKGESLPAIEEFAFTSNIEFSLLDAGSTVTAELPKATAVMSGGIVSIAAVLKAKQTSGGFAKLRLELPGSPENKRVLRKGIYERTLELTAGNAATLQGSISGTGTIRIHVGVDGVARAFIYDVDPAAMTVEGNVRKVEEVELRVTRAEGYDITTTTQPVPAVPLRVEVDNPPAGAQLELWIRGNSTPRDQYFQPLTTATITDRQDETEVLKIGPPREEAVWLETPSENGGLLFTTRSRDWIVPVDARLLRGEVQIFGVLRTGSSIEQTRSTRPFYLKVDDTAPDTIVFEKLPAKHIKGTPLPVVVSASDPETDIKKVVFFLAKPDEDDKIPADAKKIVAEKTATTWTAAIPLLPEQKGEFFITAQITNQAGLTSQQTQRVVLVDPPPPLGSIAGRVKQGERNIPGATVKLANADGKFQGEATTDPAGKFQFLKLAPGKYTVTASRKDSVSETKATAEVIVEAGDKPAKAELSLTRPR